MAFSAIRTVSPEPAFLRYRYTNLGIGVAVAIGFFSWLVLISLAAFLIWAFLVLLPATIAGAWYPAHTDSIAYVLGERQLLVKHGIFFRVRKYIPYSRITDVTIQQGPLERRFGISTMVVQTAGTPSVTASLRGLGDPEGFRRFLFEKGPLGGNGT
jgi:membrane protein YdbS with pleckstrin-like domain